MHFQNCFLKKNVFSKLNMESLKIKNFSYFSHIFCLLRKNFSNISKKEKSEKSYTFSCKESKFSKVKCFLVIMIRHFFSFYNIFFYTSPVQFFHLLRDFCKIRNHIVCFFLLIPFTSFFCSLSLFSCLYLADKFIESFIYMKKSIQKFL